MNSMFLKSFKQLSDLKESAISQFKKVPTEKFNTRVIEGKWSASELMEHMILVERVSLNYMKKKFAGVETSKPSGLIHSIRLKLLSMFLRSRLKFKAPPVVSDALAGTNSIDQLIAEWDLVRNELHEFYTQMPASFASRLIYKHTIAGRMNPQQALVVMLEHGRHHLPQIQTLITTTNN